MSALDAVPLNSHPAGRPCGSLSNTASGSGNPGHRGPELPAFTLVDGFVSPCKTACRIPVCVASRSKSGGCRTSPHGPLKIRNYSGRGAGCFNGGGTRHDIAADGSGAFVTGRAVPTVLQPSCVNICRQIVVSKCLLQYMPVPGKMVLKRGYSYLLKNIQQFFISH